MLQEPFYDPKRSYEENYDVGPFGAFADGETFPSHVPKFDFLGFKIAYPFGIPAGPLLNSKFMKAAFQKGFDVNVYKTTRSRAYPSHPYPNVLSVKIEGDLTYERAQQPLVADSEYVEPLSITNSFGVPSKEVAVWQADAKNAQAAEGSGQISIMSFMGTVWEGQSADEFVADFREAARLAAQVGAKVYEANLSCPNIGNEGLVCYDLSMTEKVARAMREELGDAPLILKVGFYKDEMAIQELVRVASVYANGIASINTLPASIVNADGTQALPGNALRLKSGVCGAGIKWAGVEMVQRLVKAREAAGSSLAIIGVGGVIHPQDFREFRDAGADLVMSATGAMWNPYLAQEIKKAYPNG